MTTTLSQLYKNHPNEATRLFQMNNFELVTEVSKAFMERQFSRIVNKEEPLATSYIYTLKESFPDHYFPERNLKIPADNIFSQELILNSYNDPMYDPDETAVTYNPETKTLQTMRADLYRIQVGMMGLPRLVKDLALDQQLDLDLGQEIEKRLGLT